TTIAVSANGDSLSLAFVAIARLDLRKLPAHPRIRLIRLSAEKAIAPQRSHPARRVRLALGPTKDGTEPPRLCVQAGASTCQPWFSSSRTPVAVLEIGT